MAEAMMARRDRKKGMSSDRSAETAPGEPVVYQIKVEGYLGCQWADWFDGMTINRDVDGCTLLTGPVIDQAALFGLLKKVRDLGVPLVSVSQVQFSETRTYRSEKG
jgi:hypothetical protein